MESLGWFDYVFWLPLLLWVGLFLWFYRRAYPVFLKKMVKKGKKWAYVPEFISKNPGRVGQLKFFCFLLSLLVSVTDFRPPCVDNKSQIFFLAFFGCLGFVSVLSDGAFSSSPTVRLVALRRCFCFPLGCSRRCGSARSPRDAVARSARRAPARQDAALQRSR